MKKNFKKITTLVMGIIVGLSIVTSNLAYAKDETYNNYEIFTKKTPDRILNYVKIEAPKWLNDYIVEAPQYNYSLGYPINIKECDGDNRIYHFPVMRDGKIFSTLTLYDDDGKYLMQLSEDKIAKELQKMQESETLKNVNIISNEEGLFLENENGIISVSPGVVMDDINSFDKSLFNDKDMESVEGVNITDALLTLGSDIKYKNDDISGLELFENPPKNYKSRILPVKSVPQTENGKFDGTQRSWCAAAITAAIINYKKNVSLTAKDIVKEYFGEVVDKGLTNNQVISVAKTHSIFPREASSIDGTTIKGEIDNSKPIFLRMGRKKKDGEKGYHALALVGYYRKHNYFLINPWYKDQIKIKYSDNSKDISYVAPNRTYKCLDVIYSWN